MTLLLQPLLKSADVASDTRSRIRAALDAAINDMLAAGHVLSDDEISRQSDQFWNALHPKALGLDPSLKESIRQTLIREYRKRLSAAAVAKKSLPGIAPKLPQSAQSGIGHLINWWKQLSLPERVYVGGTTALLGLGAWQALRGLKAWNKNKAKVQNQGLVVVPVLKDEGKEDNKDQAAKPFPQLKAAKSDTAPGLTADGLLKSIPIVDDRTPREKFWDNVGISMGDVLKSTGHALRWIFTSPIGAATVTAPLAVLGTGLLGRKLYKKYMLHREKKKLKELRDEFEKALLEEQAIHKESSDSDSGASDDLIDFLYDNWIGDSREKSASPKSDEPNALERVAGWVLAALALGTVFSGLGWYKVFQGMSSNRRQYEQLKKMYRAHMSTLSNPLVALPEYVDEKTVQPQLGPAVNADEEKKEEAQKQKSPLQLAGAKDFVLM